MSKNERDSRYELRVGGECVMTGDAHSIGVLFGNMHGRNFDKKANPKAEHGAWLDCMVSEYKTTLPLGAAIELFSPEGTKLQQGVIGEGLAILEFNVDDGTSGQDRKSYSDTQDRDSYNIAPPGF